MLKLQSKYLKHLLKTLFPMTELFLNQHEWVSGNKPQDLPITPLADLSKSMPCAAFPTALLSKLQYFWYSLGSKA